MFTFVLLSLMSSATYFVQAGASGRAQTKITITITPAKATLFASETQVFVATVDGIDDKSVTWAVEEVNGGTITAAGLYVAPKIQGIYHVIATTSQKPQTTAVATVTVLTYCDPLPPFRR